MRATHGCRAVFVGIAAVIMISGCRADSLNFASVDGGCVPGSSMTSTGGAFVSHTETCPLMPISAAEHDSASATASEGFLQVTGVGINEGFDADFSAHATYSQQILITGPESGSGILLLLFATSFTGQTGDSGVSVNFATSSGAGGVVFNCGLDGNCPGGPATVEFTVPFTYGAPFGLTVSLSTSAGAEESLNFSDSATFASAQAGVQDTVLLGVPEPADWGMFVLGLAVLIAVKRSVDA
jgi:hypothetical protein